MMLSGWMLSPQVKFLLICMDIARALSRWSCRRSIVVSLSLCVEHMFMCFFLLVRHPTALQMESILWVFVCIAPISWWFHIGNFHQSEKFRLTFYSAAMFFFISFFTFRFYVSCPGLMWFVHFFFALNVKCFVVSSVFLPSLLVWC